MKQRVIKLPEIIHILAFLLYLYGSTLAHKENGAELSLWLMAFAVISTAATIIFPWLGFRWLKLEKKGSRFGWWVALLLQVSSWGLYSLAMFFRLGRNLPRFHNLITLTTQAWASWLIIFIYSRHAFQPKQADNTLEQTQPLQSIKETGEH